MDKIKRKIYGINFVPDNKIIYIGQTKQPGNSRFQDHLNEAFIHNTNNKLYNFMRQYNNTDFNFIVLIEDEFSLDEINELERQYIKEYDTVRNGYNTLEYSNQKIEFIGGREIDYYNNDRQFVCTFNTMADASRQLGVDVANISHCCSYYQAKTKIGWFRYKGDKTTLQDSYRTGYNLNVQKLDPFTLEVLQEYPSLQIAEKENNITRGYLSSVCSGKKLTAHGYRWQYSDETLRQPYNGSSYTRQGLAQIDIKTKQVIRLFLTTQDAQNFMGYSNGEAARRAASKPLEKTGYGYYWVYSRDYLTLIKEGKIYNESGIRMY